MLLDELKTGDGAPGAGRLADALRRTIARVVALSESEGGGEASYLNIGVSDGLCAVASRFVSGGREDAASLYVHTGRRYTCSGGVCRMIDAANGQGAVIISSEPVSGDPGWEPVPVNHVVTVSTDGAVTTVPV
jgi:predicted glutamine amidotransferase